jgi:hypothetical protein
VDLHHHSSVMPEAFLGASKAWCGVGVGEGSCICLEESILILHDDTIFNRGITTLLLPFQLERTVRNHGRQPSWLIPVGYDNPCQIDRDHPLTA